MSLLDHPGLALQSFALRLRKAGPRAPQSQSPSPLIVQRLSSLASLFTDGAMSKQINFSQGDPSDFSSSNGLPSSSFDITNIKIIQLPMGACTSTNNIVDEIHIKQILEQFQVPMPYADEYKVFQTIHQLEMQFQNISSSMPHNSIPNYSLLYAKVSNVKNKMAETAAQWKDKHAVHNHPNLLAIHSISIQNVNQVFVPCTEITLFLDFPIEPLSRHKKIVNKTSFTEDELWFLLDCIIAAQAFQQEHGIYPQSFELDDIVLVKTPFGENVYKFVDRYFKPQRQNTFSEFISSFDDKTGKARILILALAELKKTARLSPIQIAAIPKKDKYLRHNRYKSDVFIVGVLVLELVYTKRPDIYDWKRWSIDEFAYRKALDGLISKGISEKLLRFIEKMLTLEEYHRPDFVQLNVELTQSFQIANKPRLLEEYSADQFLLFPEVEKPMSNTKKIITSNQQLQSTQHPQNMQSHQHIRFKQNDASILSHESQRNQVHQPLLENTLQVVHGTLRYSNGNYYVGQVCNRRRHGRGTFYDSENNKLIEGMWAYDMPDGEATIYNKPVDMKEANHQNLARLDWIQYKGQVRHGLREGQGVLFFKDGSKFVGTFQENKACGKGLYEYPNKVQVAGFWQNDQQLA